MLNFALLQQMQTASQSLQMQSNQQQLQNQQLLAGLQSTQQQQQSILLPQSSSQILIPNLQLQAQQSSSPSPITNFSSPLGLTPNLTNSQSQMCFGSFSLTAPATTSQQTIPMSNTLSKSDELLQLQISQLVKEREFQTQQDNQQTLMIDALLAQLKSQQQQQQQQQFQQTQQSQQSVVPPFQLSSFQRQPLQVSTQDPTTNQMFSGNCNIFSSPSISIENFLQQHQKTEQNQNQQQQFLFPQSTFQFPFQSPSASQQQQQQLQQPQQQSSLTNNMNGNNNTTSININNNNNTSPLFQFQSSLQQMQTTLQSLSSLSSIQQFSPFIQQQQSQQLLPSINTMPFGSNLTLNPNKRASIDSMESSSPIEKRRRLIIDDHQSETAIRSATLIKQQQLQKQLPTPLSLKKCQSDNQHNHHSHHGTNNKHMNTSSSSAIRSRSRFHNLTKLFLNSLLSIFTKENMDASNLDAQTQESISQLIAKVKLTGRKTQGKVCKTDLFNHSHYNALFLTLTPESLKELASKSKDAAVHKACFDIDVGQYIEQSILDQINIIKKKIFEVTLKVLGNPIESESVKDEYWLRAMVGIKQLNEGKLIYRFQSINEKTSNVEEDNNKQDKENKREIVEEIQKDTLIKQETSPNNDTLNDKILVIEEKQDSNLILTSINLKNTSISEQLNLVNQQLNNTDIIQEDSPMKQLEVSVSASSSPSSRSQTSPSSSVSHKININISNISQQQYNPAHLQLQPVVQEEDQKQQE